MSRDQKSSSGDALPVLIVASGSPEQLNRAEAIVEADLMRGASLHYALSLNQKLFGAHLKARGVTLEFQPPGALACLRWIVSLRRRGFSKIVVLFTGDSWYRRLKLVGLILAFPNGLILNENGDYCRPTPANLTRHLLWRLAQSKARMRHLMRSAWHLLRRDGFGAVRRRLLMRLPRIDRLATSMRLSFPLPMQQFRSVRLQRADEPAVSIVIPAFNQWRFTYRCLASIEKHTTDVSYEVILVDNASTDRTRKIRKWTKGLRVLRLSTNRGFVDACNAGAEIARGEKLLFLNNDTRVTMGWLSALLAVTASRPDWGAVGAKLVFPGGTLQEAGGVVWQDGSAWNYGRFDDPERPEYNYVREVDYCSAAALLVLRQAFERIGGFDPAYSPGYWEDTDLCFALRHAGHSVWYQPASVVYHYEGASSGIDETQGMKRYQTLNAERFRQKWRHELREQVPFDIRSLFKARDRNRGPVIVVFDHYVPTPDRDAGSAFMYWFLKAVQDLGYRVVFWPDNLFRTPSYTDELQLAGIEVLYGALSVPDYFEAFGDFIDFAIAYRSSIAVKCLPPTKPFTRAQAYIAVDLEHLREERRCETGGYERSRVDRLRAREASLVSLADCIGVHSPVEHEILQLEFGAKNVLHLPLPVPPTPVTVTPFEERAGLLFVGSTHPPNVDAIRYFVQNVFPKVRERNPDLKLSIVGDVCQNLAGLEHSPGVHLVGFAEDLKPWLERARVFVAPLRYGAGIKGKILTAMNAGVPVVTTTIGAEGIDVVRDRSACIADADDDFADAVHRLLTQPELWRAVRRGARDLVERELGFDRFRCSVDRFMQRMEACGSDAPRKGPATPAIALAEPRANPR